MGWVTALLVHWHQLIGDEVEVALRDDLRGKGGHKLWVLDVQVTEHDFIGVPATDEADEIGVNISS